MGFEWLSAAAAAKLSDARSTQWLQQLLLQCTTGPAQVVARGAAAAVAVAAILTGTSRSTVTLAACFDVVLALTKLHFTGRSTSSSTAAGVINRGGASAAMPGSEELFAALIQLQGAVLSQASSRSASASSVVGAATSAVDSTATKSGGVPTAATTKRAQQPAAAVATATALRGSPVDGAPPPLIAAPTAAGAKIALRSLLRHSGHSHLLTAAGLPVVAELWLCHALECSSGAGGTLTDDELEQAGVLLCLDRLARDATDAAALVQRRGPFVRRVAQWHEGAAAKRAGNAASGSLLPGASVLASPRSRHRKAASAAPSLQGGVSFMVVGEFLDRVRRAAPGHGIWSQPKSASNLVESGDDDGVEEGGGGGSPLGSFDPLHDDAAKWLATDGGGNRCASPPLRRRRFGTTTGGGGSSFGGVGDDDAKLRLRQGPSTPLETPNDAAGGDPVGHVASHIRIPTESQLTAVFRAVLRRTSCHDVGTSADDAKAPVSPSCSDILSGRIRELLLTGQCVTVDPTMSQPRKSRSDEEPIQRLEGGPLPPYLTEREVATLFGAAVAALEEWCPSNSN